MFCYSSLTAPEQLCVKLCSAAIRCLRSKRFAQRHSELDEDFVSLELLFVFIAWMNHAHDGMDVKLEVRQLKLAAAGWLKRAA
jgi:hypothetical protein